MRLSSELASIDDSGTLNVARKIEILRKKKIGIIDLAAGEPDIITPKMVLDGIKKAIDDRKTRYSSAQGLPELRNKIAAKLRKEGLMVNETNILVTNGAKQAIFNALQTILNKSDEVIIFKPFWPSFPNQVKLSGAKPIIVDTINHQLNVEKIKESVNTKTKAIIINNPNNPTGAVYKKKDMKLICDLAIDHNFFVISDEVYSMFVYNGLSHISTHSLSEEIQDRLITIQSFSKSYSMTGLRVGYAVANTNLIKDMTKLQGHTTGNVSNLSQYGAIASFDIDKKLIDKKIIEFEKRRNLAYKMTKKLFECIKPNGAFYLFPNVENSFNSHIRSSQDFADYMLEKKGVALVAGDSFGAKGHVRLSYAASVNEIKNGFEKIAEAL